MERPPPPSSVSLDLTWLDVPLERWFGKKPDPDGQCNPEEEEQYQSKDDAFLNRAKAWVLDSIVWAYWGAVVAQARDEGLSERRVVTTLGQSTKTAQRRRHKENPPQARSILGALLLVLQCEPSHEHFAKPALVWRTVRRVLALIRENVCEGGDEEPTLEEFNCVRWFLRHPRSVTLITREQRSNELTVEVLGDVLYWLGRQCRGGLIKSGAQVRQALEKWRDPYLLFLHALPPGWEVLDDDSV